MSSSREVQATGGGRDTSRDINSRTGRGTESGGLTHSVILRTIQFVNREKERRSIDEAGTLVAPLARLCPLFRSISNESLTRLLMLCQYKRVNKNHVIVRQGELGDCSYIQLTGRSSLYINTPAPDEPTFSISAELLQPDDQSDVSPCVSGVTLSGSDVTHGASDVTQGVLDVTQGVSDVTQDVGDVTLGGSDVSQVVNGNLQSSDTKGKLTASGVNGILNFEDDDFKPKEKLDRVKLGTFVKYYEALSSYGELALLSQSRIRTATIVSDEPLDLLVIPRQLFNETLKRRELDEINDRRLFMERSTLFNGWQPRMRRLLEMSLRKEYCPFDSFLVKQGQKITGLHFIIRGEAKITMDPTAHFSQYPSVMDGKANILAQLRSGNDQESAERSKKIAICNSAMTERVRVRRKEGYVAAERRRVGRDVTLCTVDHSQIVGATELVCGLDTYMQSVVTLCETVVFILDVRNIERLVVRPRVMSTIYTMHDKVEEKLRARLTSRVGSQIQLYHHLLAIVLEKKGQRPSSNQRIRRIHSMFNQPSPKPRQISPNRDTPIESTRSVISRGTGQSAGPKHSLLQPGAVNVSRITNSLIVSPAAVNYHNKKISAAHEARTSVINRFTRTLPRSRRELEKLSLGKPAETSRITLRSAICRSAVNVYLNPAPIEISSDLRTRSRISTETGSRDAGGLDRPRTGLSYEEDDCESDESSEDLPAAVADKTIPVDVYKALSDVSMRDVIRRLGEHREHLFNSRTDVILGVADDRRRWRERKLSVGGRYVRQVIPTNNAPVSDQIRSRSDQMRSVSGQMRSGSIHMRSGSDQIRPGSDQISSGSNQTMSGPEEPGSSQIRSGHIRPVSDQTRLGQMGPSQTRSGQEGSDVMRSSSGNLVRGISRVRYQRGSHDDDSAVSSDDSEKAEQDLGVRSERRKVRISETMRHTNSQLSSDDDTDVWLSDTAVDTRPHHQRPRDGRVLHLHGENTRVFPSRGETTHEETTRDVISHVHTPRGDVFDWETSEEALGELEKEMRRFYERDLERRGERRDEMGDTGSSRNTTRTSTVVIHPMKRFNIKTPVDVPFPAGTVLVRSRPSTSHQHTRYSRPPSGSHQLRALDVTDKVGQHNLDMLGVTRATLASPKLSQVGHSASAQVAYSESTQIAHSKKKQIAHSASTGSSHSTSIHYMSLSEGVHSAGAQKAHSAETSTAHNAHTQSAHNAQTLSAHKEIPCTADTSTTPAGCEDITLESDITSADDHNRFHSDEQLEKSSARELPTHFAHKDGTDRRVGVVNSTAEINQRRKGVVKATAPPMNSGSLMKRRFGVMETAGFEPSNQEPVMTGQPVNQELDDPQPRAVRRYILPRSAYTLLCECEREARATRRSRSVSTSVSIPRTPASRSIKYSRQTTFS